MRTEGVCSDSSDHRLVVDLRPQPHSKLDYPLKFFCTVKPAIVVADPVGWQVVVNRVLAAGRVGKHMVGLPLPVNRAAADMAAVIGFLQNRFSISRQQILSPWTAL
jgi:hypothetical protein